MERREEGVEELGGYRFETEVMASATQERQGSGGDLFHHGLTGKVGGTHAQKLVGVCVQRGGSIFF